MPTTLFAVEPTGRCRLSLRRFRHTDEGETHLHDRSVVVDEDARSTFSADGVKHLGAVGTRVPHDDPRWPTCCACGEMFAPDDVWQVNEIDWYEGGGQRFGFGVGSWDGVPGAMFRTPWRDVDGRPEAWTIFLPNRTAWNTNDRASTDEGTMGDYWTVSGAPPDLTVSLSIDDRGARPWHGHITSGQMLP